MKSMKLALIGAVLIAASATTAMAVPTWYPGVQEATDSMTITGYMPYVVSVSIAETSGYSELDLRSAESAQIADITYASNKAGFSLKVSSANTWKLMNGSDPVAYSLQYGATATAAATVSGANQVVTLVDSGAKTGKAGVSGVLLVDIADQFPAPGAYSDTLTFTISAP